MSHQPMRIVECQGVFVETFLLDDHNTIAFISLVGKDTALQAFRAQWSLPVSQGGLSDFQVETEDTTLRLNLGDIKKLDSLSGRLSTPLFGDLVQLWLFSKLAQKPDYANRKALQLYRLDDDNHAMNDNLWTLVKDLSHLPLLDQWREVILELFSQKDWIKSWQGIGGISAHYVHLPENELELLLQANIQSGALLAEANSCGQFIDAKKQTMAQPIVQSNDDSDNDANDDFWSDAEVISTYTREQAIDDGVLVDVSQLAQEAGFIVPVAMTSEAWRKCVYWPTDYGSHQDETGRLWDVLYLAFLAMKRAKSGGTQLIYKLLCIPADGSSLDALEVELKLISGPGDDGEHVITIMLPNES